MKAQSYISMENSDNDASLNGLVCACVCEWGEAIPASPLIQVIRIAMSCIVIKARRSQTMPACYRALVLDSSIAS